MVPMRLLNLSNDRLSLDVLEDNGVVVGIVGLAKRFLDCPLEDLKAFVKQFGGLEVEVLIGSEDSAAGHRDST